MKIYLAMIFVVFEILSMLFNQYFIKMNIGGFDFPFNVSVIFFCLGFFILDIVTEIYDSKEAYKLIYGKILCQIIFIVFAQIGIIGAGQEGTQLSQIMSTTPKMVSYSIIASIVGYKLTVDIMQNLKLRYQGQYLVLRYLSSTLPGEIIFTLVFSTLSFSYGKGLSQAALIFFTLTGIKLFLSFIFAILIVPVTNLLIYFNDERSDFREILPFS